MNLQELIHAIEREMMKEGYVEGALSHPIPLDEILLYGVLPLVNGVVE